MLNKTFFTYEQQIEKLKKEKQLVISDTNFAKNTLQKLSYFNKSISLPSHYQYITHHATIYQNVPLWMAANALTFGQISKMYQYATTDIRAKLSMNFADMTEVQFHLFIRILASCRNVCAHGERLYSFQVNADIIYYILSLTLPQIVPYTTYNMHLSSPIALSDFPALRFHHG